MVCIVDKGGLSQRSIQEILLNDFHYFCIEGVLTISRIIDNEAIDEEADYHLFLVQSLI